MEVINLLWQLGILSAVLIFGIKLGLATGLANMSKRYLAMVSIGYGGGVLILTEISSFYTKQITDLIYTYNFEFFFVFHKFGRHFCNVFIISFSYIWNITF